VCSLPRIYAAVQHGTVSLGIYFLIVLFLIERVLHNCKASIVLHVVCEICMLQIHAGVTMSEPGFTAIMPWAAPAAQRLPEIAPGETLSVKVVLLQQVRHLFTFSCPLTFMFLCSFLIPLGFRFFEHLVWSHQAN
jgi:hypothetical protein